LSIEILQLHQKSGAMITEFNREEQKAARDEAVKRLTTAYTYICIYPRQTLCNGNPRVQKSVIVFGKWF